LFYFYRIASRQRAALEMETAVLTARIKGNDRTPDSPSRTNGNTKLLTLSSLVSITFVLQSMLVITGLYNAPLKLCEHAC